MAGSLWHIIAVVLFFVSNIIAQSTMANPTLCASAQCSQSSECALKPNDTEMEVIISVHVPRSSPPVVLKIHEYGSVTSTTDTLGVLIQGLAFISGHLSDEIFPNFPQLVKFNRLQLSFLAARPMSYRSMVDALRGFGEYMSGHQAFAPKRSVAIEIGGNDVGVIHMDIARPGENETAALYEDLSMLQLPSVD
ncbi:uncharacterized protein KY384_003488 [Bacidia gigantensis]|uniref:uncharacterized protein n=1 Tax=Bacidia gigantensis TaxID=2732470 RepID=UPI001D0550DA|nr:uncharacterized protein KY384_003488 [Bacidia gigantensis]KAG8531852.1 hypothetical protein KY384_003488 [Bacidia gigantensis]